MKNYLIPVIAIIALPMPSKADFFSRSVAVGIQAASECHAEIGTIRRSDISRTANDALNDLGIAHFSTWLRTSNAKKAVSITKRYLDNNCLVDPLYQVELGEKIVPYVLN